MPDRHRFPLSFALSLLSLPSLFAQESRGRRTRWEMMMNDEPPHSAPRKPQPATWSDAAFTAAWIGHATVLIKFFGRWIITDPDLSERIGFNVANVFTIRPKRLVYPALTFEELPRINLILLSHAHMDAKNTFDVIEDPSEVKHFGWRYPWEKDRSRGYWDGRSSTAPEQALEMTNQMPAHYILPMHWNTFLQSEEPTAEPMERLLCAAPIERIAPCTIGETWTLPPTAEQPATRRASEHSGE